MQKIMFEHKRFGLEQAVIARLKDNTRRRVRFPKGINDQDVESAVMGIEKDGGSIRRVKPSPPSSTASMAVAPGSATSGSLHIHLNS